MGLCIGLLVCVICGVIVGVPVFLIFLVLESRFVIVLVFFLL